MWLVLQIFWGENFWWNAPIKPHPSLGFVGPWGLFWDRGLFCGKYVVVLAIDDVLEIWFRCLQGDDRIRGCELNDRLLDFLSGVVKKKTKYGDGKKWFNNFFELLAVLSVSPLTYRFKYWILMSVFIKLEVTNCQRLTINLITRPRFCKQPLNENCSTSPIQSVVPIIIIIGVVW